MIEVLGPLLRDFLWFALGYFVVLNTWYLVLLALAGLEAVGEVWGAPFAGHDDIFHSPLAPAITIVVPAHNDERSIVGCVRGLLHLRYPEFEVIVVDDGSTDRTFRQLYDAFDLAEIPRVVRDDLPIVGPIASWHAPRNRERLTVVRKAGAGPADAMNVGINAARHPLVCRVGAASYPDEQTLLALAKPFIEDPVSVIAVGATIRVANGSTLEDGRVVRARMPKGWLTRIQAVEYVRSFLIGGVAWSRMRTLLFVSGVFGLFRRDVLVDIGGFDPRSRGDDLELLTRLHHRLRQAGRPYRLPFVADPCCWTQVPSTYSALARQRRRWAQTIAETISTHRGMVANPRYGLMGLLVLPYFLVFELLGALVEVAAVPALVGGLVLGLIDPTLAVLFLVSGLGYATLLSILALAIEDFSYHRYRSWRDLALTTIAALVENLGYRQLDAWWRLRGLPRLFRRRRPDLGSLFTDGERRTQVAGAGSPGHPQASVPVPAP